MTESTQPLTAPSPAPSRAFARTLLVLAVFGAALVTGGWMLQHGAGTGVTTPAQGAHLFESVRQAVREKYVDTVSDARLYRMAVDGLLYELNDPYSTYLPPARLGAFTESTSGNYGGLGIQIDLRDGWIVVIAPLPGSPAESAGVLTGDLVVEIGGKTTKGWTTDEAMKALRGKPGTTVSFRIARPGIPGTIPMTLVRRAIHQSAVRRAAMLTADVGYIDVKAFSDSTVLEMQNALDSLLKRGMTSLVLDLRANPGGLLEQGVRVSDLFLTPGQAIVSIRGRTPDATRSFADRAPQQWPSLPLVVLVDGRSASASEVVAGALQDHDRAVIVGTPTYGKGSAQTLYRLGDQGALKLTTARWYTPAGRSIDRPHTRADDGDAAPTSSAPRIREKFKTAAGRVVYGGGGIMPDIAAGDTGLAPTTLALQQALGNKMPRFRDAVTEYALALKAARTLKSPAFVITPDVREALWKRLRARGVDISRSVYDEAEPFISRMLSYEIARYVFGPEAEFRRRSGDDKVMRAALQLLSGVKSQQELLTRTIAQQRAHEASPRTVPGTTP